MTPFNHRDYTTDRKYWEYSIDEFLALVMTYKENKKSFGRLLKTGVCIIFDRPDIIGVTVLYDTLLSKYPGLIPDVQMLEDDESGDDSGPMAITQGETIPKTLAQMMRSHEHTTGRSYQ